MPHLYCLEHILFTMNFVVLSRYICWRWSVLIHAHLWNKCICLRSPHLFHHYSLTLSLCNSNRVALWPNMSENAVINLFLLQFDVTRSMFVFCSQPQRNLRPKVSHLSLSPSLLCSVFITAAHGLVQAHVQHPHLLIALSHTKHPCRPALLAWHF